MDKKIERLEKAINKNKNLSDKFKENFVTLINLLVTNLPEYDYSYFEEILSNLNIKDDEEMIDYSSYDKETNILKLNRKKILEDRIDVEHLFLKKVLSIGTHKEAKEDSLKQFYDSISSAMAQFIIGNEGCE